MSDAPVLHDKRGHAFWITINRPDKRNALNASVIAGIVDGFRRAHEDNDVRVIVLTGTGDKAFCAGADLQPGAGFAFDLSQPNLAYADMLRAAQNATKPTIARVNGVCMAGGIGLLCMTDMAVAADNVIFGLPEVKVGVFPMQVLSLLQTIAPPRLVREWCFTGEPFSALEAKEAGLLNHVVPATELDAKVEWLVGRLIDKSPTAIRRGKYAMRALASMSFDQGIAYTESQIALLSMTQDAKEGLAAFAEKRKPVWTGK
jgi:enoyl-CoA hydratase/carnithine racemase